ncbi:uncharacterized protein [Pempheris klunzingeri]|uniref:uncharacterized protein n=1 Tax=Pempheris klunzingeri TaxID=3127111 RepID=UPI00397E9444
MVGSSSPVAADLAVLSVVTLILLSLLCLRCKRKSKVIHEEHQIYNPQMFQRGGSLFAVIQSKTVTRGSQIISTTIETHEDVSPAEIDEASDYQNISDAQTGSMEPTYVDPLPISVYENEELNKTTTETQGVYANITLPMKEDDDDYVNSEFLGLSVKEQEDEDIV